MSDSECIAGRYQVEDKLGEGGMGVVYRVRDTATGHVLALKVLPRTAGRSGLRGEFAALARLRHPNVVEVHDYGRTEAGADFFTMALVPGRDLRALAPRPAGPHFYPLVAGAFRALAFLHARGMVHADVKPSNLLVDEEALAADPGAALKLVDFGLAASVSDPHAAAARGTFPYAAPEVYAGRLDARSDLYALGVVLYEILTGSLPYPGSDVVGVIRAQRRAAPPDPRQLDASIPAELAELVLTLLDPEPGARLQTADEVLDRLAELSGVPAAAREADSVVLPDFSGSLIGRDRDLGFLEELWSRAQAGRGQVAVLVGEAGIGKSRMAGELKLRVQLAGGRSLTGRSGGSGAPYGALGDAVRALVAEHGTRHPQLVGLRRTALAPLIGEDPAGVRAAAAPERERRFALAEAVAGLLLDLARIDPLLVVLEDMGEVGRAEAELFGYLARAAGSGRVMLVACVGLDTPGEEPAVLSGMAGVPGIGMAEHVHRIDLAPLDRGSVRGLLAAMVGPAIADALAADVHRVSGGNPAYLLAAMRELAVRGDLVRKRGTWMLTRRPEVAPPPDAIEAALARYRALGNEARRVLEDAAVLGDEFAFEDLVHVAATPASGGAEIAELLGRATAARLIAPSPGGGGEFVWSHRGLRQAIYQGVARERRSWVHAAASERLEARAAAGARVSAEALAEHALANEVTQPAQAARAARLAVEAAETRRTGLDFHGAIGWLERARKLAVQDALGEGPTIDERLGDLYAAVGETVRAREAFEAAATRMEEPRPAGPPGPRLVEGLARIARKLGELLRRGGDSALAIDRLQSALTTTRRARRDPDEAALHLTLGRVRMYRGEYAAATEHATAGMVLARAAGDHGLASRLGRLRGVVELFRGDARAAGPHIETALDDANRAGSERDVADALGDLGHACFRRGDYARAIECFERALPIDERLGLVEQTAKILNNLGIACFFQGNWARARESWERFRDLCERVGEATELVNALNNLGQLYKDQGDFTLALATLDRGARLAERVGHAHLAATILGNRGEILARQGDSEGARACYERCRRLFDELGAKEDALENRRRLCELDLSLDRIDAALDQALDAARDAKQQGARLEEASLHRVAAAALRAQGDLDSAAWFLERAREIATTLGASYERAKVDLEAAELAAVKGDLKHAEASAAAAVDAFATLGARWDLTRARDRRRQMTDVGPAIQRGALGSGGFEVVLDIARASGRIELDRLLEIVLEKILEVTDFDRGFILLLDERGRPTERKRRVRDGSGDAAFEPEEAQFSASVVRRVAQTGEPLAVTDIDDDAALREQRSVVLLGLRSVLCAPMRRHGRVIGIIYVDSRKLADDDSEAPLALLEALASQAAVAVENAKLIAEEQRKTELMAILAHEIRNPLSSILGYSELMGEEAKVMGPETAELFERIHRDGLRLKRLVDNILEVSRVEAGKVDWSMAAVPLPQVIADTIDSFAPMATRKGVKLVAEVAPELPSAIGNTDRIYQVVTNLVANALKFTPSGGTITIRAREELLTAVDSKDGTHPADELSAWVPLTPQAGEAGHFVRVDVADTGPGLPPERRDRLFEKFAQGDAGKKHQHGLGLGLFISREIIRRHGGTIWVDSNPSQGAVFSFRLPRAK